MWKREKGVMITLVIIGVLLVCGIVPRKRQERLRRSFATPFRSIRISSGRRTAIWSSKDPQKRDGKRNRPIQPSGSDRNPKGTPSPRRPSSMRPSSLSSSTNRSAGNIPAASLSTFIPSPPPSSSSTRKSARDSWDKPQAPDLGKPHPKFSKNLDTPRRPRRQQQQQRGNHVGGGYHNYPLNNKNSNLGRNFRHQKEARLSPSFPANSGASGAWKAPGESPPPPPHSSALLFRSKMHMRVRADRRFQRTILIGDVHGCFVELKALLKKARFNVQSDRLVLAGDLVGKGPYSRQVVEFVRKMGGIAVRGNHDHRAVKAHAGMLRTLKTEVKKLVDELGAESLDWLATLPLSIFLEEYKAYVVHAGVMPHTRVEQNTPELLMNLRGLGNNRRPTMKHGEGEPWAQSWEGPELVIFGHDATRRLQVHKYALGLDTGCVHGGNLTALILPEFRLISVRAQHMYKPPKIPWEDDITAAAASVVTPVDPVSSPPPSLSSSSSSSSPPSSTSSTKPLPSTSVRGETPTGKGGTRSRRKKGGGGREEVDSSSKEQQKPQHRQMQQQRARNGGGGRNSTIDSSSNISSGIRSDISSSSSSSSSGGGRSSMRNKAINSHSGDSRRRSSSSSSSSSSSGSSINRSGSNDSSSGSSRLRNTRSSSKENSTNQFGNDEGKPMISDDVESMIGSPRRKSKGL